MKGTFPLLGSLTVAKRIFNYTVYSQTCIKRTPSGPSLVSLDTACLLDIGFDTLFKNS